MALGDSDSRFGGSEISTGNAGQNFGSGPGGIAGGGGGGGPQGVFGGPPWRDALIGGVIGAVAGGPIGAAARVVSSFLGAGRISGAAAGLPSALSGRGLSASGQTGTLVGAGIGSMVGGGQFTGGLMGQVTQGLRDAFRDAIAERSGSASRAGSVSKAGLSPMKVAKMTVAQKRMAGIYHNAAGKKVGAKAVTANALANLMVGKKLTKNQQALVGKRLLNMNQNQRDLFTEQLALAKGGNFAKTRQTFNRPLGQAMKAWRKVKQNARKNWR